ncbi:MAG: histidine kinase [Bacteroidia bacterium]
MHNLIFFFLGSIFSVSAFAQSIDGLVARYSFNKGQAVDDVSGGKAGAVGVLFVDDRFGNSEAACMLNGSRASYLNLGTETRLKPHTGSIAIWVMLLSEMHAGTGYLVNPVILTKCKSGDDFFEAYSISYSLQTKRMGVCSTDSDTTQLPLVSKSVIALGKWYHVVMTYSDTEMSLYINGVLENHTKKNFRTHFLDTDSVMVGYTSNEKNNRFLIGAVDDLVIYSHVLTADEVLDLYNEPDPNRWRVFMKWFLLVMLLCACMWIMVQFFTRKIKQQLMREKEKNSTQSKLYEMEMRVVKAQMNPHFIFNAMNSIQQFVLSNDSENANNYLIRFSRLLRKTLESNTDETISLANEIDILEKYMEIEALRFVGGFRFTVICDDEIDKQTTQIPQLLIQPLVENAIWHGLIPKVGDKVITITFELIDASILQCTIDDNGIGRTAAQETKIASSRISLGIPFIQQRLELLSKVSGKIYRLDIVDKVDARQKPLGTTILLRIPLHQNK